MENELYAEYEKLSDAALASIEKCVALDKDFSVAQMMGYDVTKARAELLQVQDETQDLITASDLAYEKFQHYCAFYCAV